MFHWWITNLFLFATIVDNLLWLRDEYLVKSTYYAKYLTNSIHYPDRDFLNVWFHYCMMLIFDEPWKWHVHIRFSYRTERHVDHSNNILVHGMFELTLMFLFSIDQSNAKHKRHFTYKKSKPFSLFSHWFHRWSTISMLGACFRV